MTLVANKSLLLLGDRLHAIQFAAQQLWQNRSIKKWHLKLRFEFVVHFSLKVRYY